MSTTEPNPERGSSRPSSNLAQMSNSFSCMECRRKKVRCNKKQPCSACLKANEDCVFPEYDPHPRKRKRRVNTELLSRLGKLEDLVQTMSTNIYGGIEQHDDGGPDGNENNGSELLQHGTYSTPKSSVTKHTLANDVLDRLVVNKERSRYVSNEFWVMLSDEIEEMRDILDTPSDENDHQLPDNVEPGLPPPHGGFIFGFNSLSHDLHSLIPPSRELLILWDAYKENVDPLTKIFHRPTTQKLIMDPSIYNKSSNRDSEAIVFSVCYSAVTSLNSSQCALLLGEDKGTLLARYRFAIEQALARAGFLETHSLTILQSLTLFLICARNQDDSRFVWTVSGIAVRLAHTLGIHRDGSNFGLTPFETEMRRRLWWNICLLDGRSSEDHGTSPEISVISYDTRFPLNINDDDISPELKEYPQEKLGFTEMTFCLILFEVNRVVHRFTYAPLGSHSHAYGAAMTLESRDECIDSLSKRLEDRYIRYCNTDTPLPWICATVSRLLLSKMWLSIYYPLQRKELKTDPPQNLRDRLLFASIEVIEFTLLIKNDENTAHWGWLFSSYVQWHALVFVLIELCVRQTCPAVERAWKAVRLASNEGYITGQYEKSILWRPVARLAARARERYLNQSRQGSVATQFPCDTTFAHTPSVIPGPTPKPPTSILQPESSALDISFNNNITEVHQHTPLSRHQEDNDFSVWLSTNMDSNNVPGPDHPSISATSSIARDENQQLSEWSQIMRDFRTDIDQENRTLQLENSSTTDKLLFRILSDDNRSGFS
ncbi:hypothetical protein LT330_008573 [Penicillium expansum]|nr:hypothetical protein LT330_008573 [Penicillium expansum]